MPVVGVLEDEQTDQLVTRPQRCVDTGVRGGRQPVALRAAQVWRAVRSCGGDRHAGRGGQVGVGQLGR
ncbi:MAG: hypothetical protein E6G57_11315 [Actinobacteria bacterium]|nr:MAG: hypothetical protein E6G57_11315 [Actinomycetota bacterium]